MSVLQQWLESRLQFLRPKSVAAYKDSIKIIQRYLRRKRIKFSKISSQDLQMFISWMFSQGYAHESVRLCMKVVKMCLDYVELMDPRERFSADKILKRVKLPREKKKKPVCMTKEECDRVLAYLKSKHHHIYVPALMAYLTGMRLGEILRLRIKDVDAENKTVFISEQQKNGKETYIPLIMHPDLLTYIEYRKSLKVDHDSMFVGKRMLPLGRYALQKYLHRASIDTGITFHMHTFRHSIATHLVKAGTPLPSVQKLLRHADIKTTMIYVNFLAEDVRDDIEKMHPLAHAAEAIAQNKGYRRKKCLTKLRR